MPCADCNCGRAALCDVKIEAPSNMFKCNSSNIDWIDYNDESNTLTVAFHSGSVYDYSNVDKDVYETFKTAESVGKFFNANVKNRYEYKLRTSDPAPEEGLSVNIVNVEVTRLNLKPGDVLMVKITSDIVSADSLAALRQQLTTIFPNNKVMLFAMSASDDIELSVVEQTEGEEINESN